jgi:hypothetical protein
MLAVADMPSTPTTDAIQEPTRRIRRDFSLLPGLALTVPQARRLWALQDNACRDLLDTLVAEGFLRVRADARYVMRDGCRETA